MNASCSVYASVPFHEIVPAYVTTSVDARQWRGSQDDHSVETSSKLHMTYVSVFAYRKVIKNRRCRRPGYEASNTYDAP